MANILTYFTINNENILDYSYNTNNTLDIIDKKIYYKYDLIFSNTTNQNLTTHIYNYKTNVFKIILNGIIVQITNQKYRRDLNNKHFTLYYKNDKYLKYGNKNYIFFYYMIKKYKLKYCYNIKFDHKFENQLSINIRYYNNMIFRYITRYYIDDKYLRSYILVPNKYELYYYSNFLYLY